MKKIGLRFEYCLQNFVLVHTFEKIVSRIMFTFMLLLMSLQFHNFILFLLSVLLVIYKLWNCIYNRKRHNILHSCIGWKWMNYMWWVIQKLMDEFNYTQTWQIRLRLLYVYTVGLWTLYLLVWYTLFLIRNYSWKKCTEQLWILRYVIDIVYYSIVVSKKVMNCQTGIIRNDLNLEQF